jgi:hypothetical protein
MRRWLLTVLFLATFSSCSAPDDGSPSPPTSELVRIPRAEPDEITLFAREDNTFLTYDLATGEPATRRVTDPNFFGYEFTSLHPIYTAGDSYRGGFVAVQRKGRNFVELTRTPPGVDLLPLATDGEQTFFVRAATNPQPGDSDEIVELEHGHLRPLPGDFGEVYSGALVGDALFLSVFHPELGNTFQLTRLDLTPGSGPVASSLHLLRRGMRSGRLVTDGRDVFFETATGISNGRRTLPCQGLCYFAEGSAVLLDYLPVSSDHPESGNVLLLRDSRTGQVIERRPGVVDFDLEGSALVLYTWRGVDRLSLREL